MLFVAIFFLVPMCPRAASAYDALVQWQAVTGANAYRIYVRQNSGAYALARQKSASASTGTPLSDVVPSVALELSTRFAVTSVNNSGMESVMSNEVVIAYANAARIVDSDGDGLTDAEEDLDLDRVVDANETNPFDADSDDDGLTDYDERVVTLTNPLNADTDGDGASDGVEYASGTDPRSANSSPNVWVLASDDFASFAGAMKTGTQYAGGADSDPAADSLGARLVFANSTVSAMSPGSGDDVSYAIQLPKGGQWYLWARLYFPGTPGTYDANSFFVSVDGGPTFKLGNNIEYFQKWHWGGDGNVEAGTPVSLALGYLAAGVHVLTVEKREVTPVPPRLDALMLTLDSKGKPTDSAARIALASALTKCTSNAACDDHNACNGQETCNPSVGCVAGTPLVCDNGNKCDGTETCDPTSGCKSGTPLVCNDNNACNGIETCVAATGCKAGTPLVCNDGNACNGVETCSAATGCKAGTPLVCNDNNACNGVETCVAATGCKAGTPPVCDDGNACNGVETCSAATGCKSGTPLVCSDGDACNGLETCDAVNGCEAGTPPRCDDGNVCNGVETCDSTRGCVAGTALTCDDGQFCDGIETCDPKYGCMPGIPVECGIFAHQCQDARCNEAGQACTIVAKPDGTSCNDGLACTGSDACAAGTCRGVDFCPEGEACGAHSGVCELTGDRDNDGLFDAEDPCPDEARNECAGPVAVDRTKRVPIRVNAGAKGSCSGRRTDCNGDVWYEDFGYRKNLGSTSCTIPGGCLIDGLEDLFGCEDARTEDVFQCDHSSLHPNRRIVYTFDVPDGVYVVNLYFANTQSATGDAGDRKFDIVLEGAMEYPMFDQVQAAGGSAAAVVRSAIVDVVDGNGLTIALVPRVGQVAVKAIEVLAATP